MPELFRLVLLAFPAGLIGFIAAPCCSLLVPVYLPFAMAAPPPAPQCCELPVLNQPAATAAGGSPPAVRIAAAPPAAPAATAGRGRQLRGLAVFLAGFCLFFVLLGAGASTLGGFLLNQLPALEKISGGFLIALGVIMVTRLRIKLPSAGAWLNPARLRSGPLGAFGMGFAIAVTWAPCTGPTLGGILALSATSTTVWTGMALLLLYALGLAAPFALMSIALTTARRLVAFQSRHARALEAAGGILMITGGVLILIGGYSARETAERRLEAIGTQLPAVLAAYKNGKTQQAYTMAKSISAKLYEGTTEGICSKTDSRDDRQIDSLLAATLPAAIQNHESAGQVATLTARAQALARGCLNAIHRSE
jgi:cytochrome c-type biogenesis protein